MPSIPGRPLPTPVSPGPLLPWLLTALAPTPRTRVKQLLKHGAVRVNGRPVTRHDFALAPGDAVTIGGQMEPHPTVPIVYEDDAVGVVDKPAGLLTVATAAEKEDTVFRRLAAVWPARPAVVHRLDRETSGLLLFARSPEIRDRLQRAWDRVEKVYLAVVEGVPRPAEGRIENYLTEGKSLRVTASPRLRPGAKRAVSRYRTIRSGSRHSLVEVILETGRKHQIRVHLAGLGCPVIGDETYGAKTNPAHRLGLHATRLAFDHPVTGKRIVVESPLPAALARIV
ncbi:MAG TPA: RluA family pseudouridine synthase [Fimbriiglobus sp.]|jgi:23S rRNA pseudouridine1911/1915/1917 synthase